MRNKRRILLFVVFCVCWCMGNRVFAQTDGEVEERINRAISLGLQEWIDEEGYLMDHFYDGKSDSILTDLGLDGLVRTMSEEELEAYVANLNMGISFYAVTYYKKVSQVNPSTGKTLYTGVFEVDGKLAFCIERSMSTPPKDSPTGPPIEVTNEDLRKVLYYGYNGPEDQGYTYVETALAAGEANGDGDNSLGRNVLAQIKLQEKTPDWFKVWKVETNGGTTQDLAYYTIVKDGMGQIQKISTCEELTANNSSYSLEGAVFGIYSDEQCLKEVGMVSTDIAGMSESFNLSPGLYYVKELIAPQGYKRNDKINSLEIREAETTLLVVENEPISIRPDILLQKVDSETGNNNPQGNGTLYGAEFLVEFYDGIYEDRKILEEGNVEPCREWYFQTDEEGKIEFKEEYLLKGDCFWKDDMNETVLPLGTLLIQEKVSSEGYRINHDIFLLKLENESALGKHLVIPEESIQFELNKYQSDTNQALAGAVFRHRNPDGTEEQVVTGEDGRIVCKGLKRGIHEIEEIQAPDGYYLNKNIIRFEVTKENEIVVISEMDGELGKVETSINEQGNLSIRMEDKVGFRLPETGSILGAWLENIGLMVLCYSRCLVKRRFI